MAAPQGIVTPEAVVLDLADAGLGSRTLAFGIDLAVRLAAFFVLYLVLLPFAFSGSEAFVVITATIGAFAILFAYPAVCEALWKGQTVGKAALGLRVVTIEGAPVRFRHTAIRSALGFIDFLLTAGAAATVSVLVTRRSQRVGDLAAGTIVIRHRHARGASFAYNFVPPPGWGPWAARLDVHRLRPDQYAVVRAFLTRVTSLTAAARWTLGTDLAARTAAALGVQVPPGAHPEAFLVSVAAAYQLRNAGGPAATIPSARPDPGSAWARQAQATPWRDPTGWRLPETG